MKYFYLGTLLLSMASAFGQRQANIWHFGDARVLDFNSGVPVVGGPSSMFTFEGSASYCDDTGQLLFYTNGGGREPDFSGQDGGKIWNRNHEEMYDMQGIEGGGFSSAQSSVIFEAPGEPNVYYVFTMDEIEFDIGASPETNAAQPDGRGLSYFKVNMTLNGGLGGVTLADQRLLVPSTEGLCAIRHANGQDYWVLANDGDTGLAVFKVDANGVTQQTGFSQATGGIIKASPDGTRVLAQPYLLSFDASTGAFSNTIDVNPTLDFFEFSPNSDYLYALRNIDNSIEVFRYSLAAPDVFASAEAIASLGNGSSAPSQMQLAPDGNIYFLEFNFIEGMRLGRIKCPNTATPSLEVGLFTFTGTFFGLPNFPAWLFDNDESFTIPLGPTPLTVCDDEFPITLNAGTDGTSYLWSNGSTISSIEVNSPGTYSVTVTGACGTATAQVEVLPCAVNTDCEVFLPTGDVQLFTVPEGVDSIFVKMWGAAGGAGPDSLNNGGGGGGYAEFSLPVVPGDVLQIVVGEGGERAEGNNGGAGGYPSGGAGGSGNRNELSFGVPTDVGGAGGGGGKTVMRIVGSQNALLAIAGGGGGGANNRYGGGGGGLIAEYTADNNPFEVNGFGGTQTEGGAPGNNTLCPPIAFGEAGFSFGGGDGATSNLEFATGGGGGGDGYFGGGGGSSHDGCFGVGSTGGGGSGFLCADCTGFTGTLETAGFFGVAANAADPLFSDYPGTATGFPRQNGGNGLVQICFNIPECSPVTNAITASACEVYTSEAGNDYFTSGAYVETFLAANGCDSLLTINLTIFDAPQAQATSTPTTCGDSNGSVSASASGGTAPYNYTWQPPGINLMTITDVEAGEFILSVTDANGCIASDTVEVADSEPLDIDVTPSSAVINAGQSVNLVAMGGVTYVWSPADSLSCTDCPNPVATPSQSIVYLVEGTDANGCIGSEFVRIDIAVECGDPFVPTIFSPNEEGPEENNRLCIEGNCILRLEYEVYNRWGQRVFETNSLRNCWDGTFNGNDVEAGAYVYKAIITLQGGKVIEESGILTLIR